MTKSLNKIRAEREANKPINQAIAELKKEGYQFRPIKRKKFWS